VIFLNNTFRPVDEVLNKYSKSQVYYSYVIKREKLITLLQQEKERQNVYNKYHKKKNNLNKEIL
jgi:hypothetical protein